MNETIELYLHSKNANKYIDNRIANCYFTLPAIDIDPLDGHVYVNVKQAVIPYSFYNVDNNNNKLILLINGTTYTITILPGNYNVNSLISEIQSQISTFAVNDKNLTLTYISKTNKIAFTHSLNTFQILDTTTCSELIGFQNGETITATNVSGTIYQAMSINGINLFGIQQIFICSDNFVLNNISANDPNNASILASVNVSSNPNSIIQYENNNSMHLIHHVQNLTNVHIKLTSQTNDVLELNGIHFSITLQLTIVKKQRK